MISNRTIIEISADALCHNALTLQSQCRPGTDVMVVVKSNAYGHGLLLTAWALQSIADWYAVDDIEEAKLLRQHGIKQSILILGFVPEEWYPLARTLGVTLTSPSLIALRWAVNHGVQTHIKIDSGLGRQGFQGAEYDEIIQYLQRHIPATITGVYSHFAVADNPAELEFTRHQYTVFIQRKLEIEALLGRSLLTHTSGTSGVVYNHEFDCDMVRLGIGLYGVLPSRELMEHNPGLQLQPVMQWRARLSEIKHLPKGHSIGYERTHILTEDSVIGVVPVGYWHGIPRALSNIGFVEIQGQRAPVIGNISMDMMTIDLTNIAGTTLVGDWVTLIGQSVPVMELAEISGISHYELLTRINPLIERRYKKLG